MSDHKLRILAISGSVRKDSVNRALLETAKKLSSSKFEIDIYEDLAELPIFSQDAEGDSIPDIASELGKAILRADAVLISTPEYNGAIPGGLKNLLDWGSRPFGQGAFSGKTVAVIGASPSPYGASQAVEMTTKILEAMSAVVINRKLNVSNAPERVSIDGEIVDEMVAKSLSDILVGIEIAVESSTPVSN
ncbi:NAD(P)H-dependent oxidoreductase [Dehalococcoides mccartyi]|nr:NAD(P)H-dependent oxidoreductase [Dehalococcoides mccartyi]